MRPKSKFRGKEKYAKSIKGTREHDKIKREQGNFGLFQGTFQCTGYQEVCILACRMLIFIISLHDSMKPGLEDEIFLLGTSIDVE